jgi:hypothetical protein
MRVLDTPKMTVTPNGNGYDVQCPQCGYNNRVSSARPPSSESHRIDVDKISMVCKNVDSDGASLCDFSIIDGQLVSDE